MALIRLFSRRKHRARRNREQKKVDRRLDFPNYAPALRLKHNEYINYDTGEILKRETTKSLAKRFRDLKVIQPARKALLVKKGNLEDVRKIIRRIDDARQSPVTFIARSIFNYSAK